MDNLPRKSKAIIDFYKLIAKTDEIPADVLRLLTYIPYDILVVFLALDKRIKAGWGSPRIKEWFKIKDWSARKITKMHD